MRMRMERVEATAMKMMVMKMMAMGMMVMETMTMETMTMETMAMETKQLSKRRKDSWDLRSRSLPLPETRRMKRSNLSAQNSLKQRN